MYSTFAKVAVTVNINTINRFVGNYDADEKALLSKILQAYSATIVDVEFYWFLPSYKQSADGKPINLYDSHFDFAYWNGRLGTNALHEITEEIYAQICSFQKLRINTLRSSVAKAFWVDKKNDPISLMLEEIKAWLAAKLTVYDLSKGSIRDELLKEMRSRISYLETLAHAGFLADYDNKFLDGKPIQIQQILNEICGVLKNEVVNIINLESSRQSAREDFKELRDHLRKVIKQGARYIYFAFQDTPNLDSNFTIQEIRHPRLPGTKRVLDTQAGKLFSVLFSTDVMYYLFPDHTEYLSDYLNPSPTKTEHNELVSVSRSQADSYFYDSNNVLSAAYETKPGAEPAIDLWLKSTNTGIIDMKVDSKDRRKFIENFAEYHSLLVKLSSYYSLIESAYNMAGEGGNIFIYGFAGRFFSLMLAQLTADFKKFEQLLNVFKVASDVISRATLYEKTDTGTQWSNNYLFAMTSYRELQDNSLKYSFKTLNAINGHISSFDSRVKMKNLQHEFMGFLNKLGSLIQASNLDQYQNFNSMVNGFGLRLALTQGPANQEESVTYKDLNNEAEEMLKKNGPPAEDDALLLLQQIVKFTKTLVMPDDDLKRKKLLLNSARIYHRLAHFDAALSKYDQVLVGNSPTDTRFDSVIIQRACLLFEMQKYDLANIAFNFINSRKDRAHINEAKLAEYLKNCADKLSDNAKKTVLNTQDKEGSSATSTASNTASSGASATYKK